MSLWRLGWRVLVDGTLSHDRCSDGSFAPDPARRGPPSQARVFALFTETETGSWEPGRTDPSSTPRDSLSPQRGEGRGEGCDRPRRTDGPASSVLDREVRGKRLDAPFPLRRPPHPGPLLDRGGEGARLGRCVGLCCRPRSCAPRFRRLTLRREGRGDHCGQRGHASPCEAAQSSGSPRQ